MSYKGAEYLGISPLKIKGKTVKTGDIVEDMKEAEAKGRKQFKPVYSSKPKQEKKKEVKEEFFN
jgi:hypothetical protein